MENYFSIDATLNDSTLKIENYLIQELDPIVRSNRPIIFLCIGTDRSTGDSLGPLVGHKLKKIKKKNFYVFGDLSHPVHSKNLINIMDKIKLSFNNPYIVAIDACLGDLKNIGKIFINKKPLLPGAAMNKNLPPIGDISITGIVNINGSLQFMILQNTRLYTVMLLADTISTAIYHFILKSSKEKKSLIRLLQNKYLPQIKN